MPPATLPRRLRRPRLVIAGCGDVGLRLIRQLAPRLGSRARLIGLARGTEALAAIRAAGGTPIAFDLDERRPRRRLGSIASGWIHLAPTPAEGRRETRLRRVLAQMNRRRRLPCGQPVASAAPPRIVYASTTGVYGDSGGAWIDETRTPTPASDRSRRRLDAERCLRSAVRQGIQRAAVLRVPGIYAADRLPTGRLQRGLPALRDEDDGYSNHIHAEDLARLAWIALHRASSGRVYNAVDATELKMGDWFDLVADTTGLPRPQRLSRADAKALVSPMLWSFMSESRRIRAHRIGRELRARLRYPDVLDGLLEVPAPSVST
ncbi:MAG: SDR family NAD(P)-dependent oxidoreductase [Burkholderiaceae bacterium]|nr:SDR family NAD(P)-dependent oxidoreductase [Burkholderiaceae bacterium]